MYQNVRRVAVAAVAAMLAAATLVVPAEAGGGGLSSGPSAPARWSRTLPAWNRSSSPVIADLDGDGSSDVVVGAYDGYLRAYRGDGTPMWATAAVPGVAPGCNRQSTPTAISSSPSVADLDGDGRPEVVIGMGSSLVAGQNGGLIVLDGATGSVRWRWSGDRDFANIWANSPTPDGWCEGVFSTPAIGDVDGDGHPDIVFGGWDQRIWALDRFGNPLGGFPFAADDTVWSSPSLFDSNGDGVAEIYIGGDSTPGGWFDNLGGVFRSFDATGGRVVQRWVQAPNEVIMSSPAIGDIDGDGRAEVVVGTGENWFVTCAATRSCPPGAGSDHVRVFAWHADDGSPVPGFPVSTGGTVMASPALGDINGDGLADVVVGSYDGYVYAWNGNGTLIWRTQPSWAHLGTGRMIGQPIIADLNGDGTQDVAVGGDKGVAFLDGRTGVSLDSWRSWDTRAGLAWSFETAPAVGVLNGRRAIVLSGFNTPNRNGFVAAFDLPATRTPDSWPMFRKTADRTGRIVGSTCDLITQQRSFCDVPPGSYYEAATTWMVANGITKGVSPTAFGPDLALPRAQMVTFMWREAGSPAAGSATGFADVAGSAYYAQPVSWARANGITKGTSATTFSPDVIVSRAQMVTFMWRRAGSPRVSPASGFVDVSPSAYYAQPVSWARANGITKGTSSSTFSPDAAVTRAQAAAMLHRASLLP